MAWDFFNSNSETESTTNSAGSGFQDVNDLNSINLSGLEIYKSANTNLQLSQTDHASVEKGIQTAQGSVNAVADIALNTLDFSANESESNREFVGQFVGAIIDQSEGILEAAQTEIENTRAFSAGAIQYVGDTVSNASNAALLFADEQAERSALLMQSSTSEALASGRLAIESNERTTSNAMAFIGQGFSKAFDSITNFADEALRGVNEQAGINIQTVSDATRSDAANSLDKVVNMATIGIVAMAIGTALLGSKA